MNWDIILDSAGLYLSGLRLTLGLTLASLLFSFLLAVPLALAKWSGGAVTRAIISGYTLLFRGTPLLIQLFLIYFGLAQFELLRESWLWPWLSSPLVCVLLAFVLNSAAYSTEIFAAGLAHLPRGEIEAARAFGMSAWVRTRRIYLPAMLTRSLPLYGNEAVMLMHATSLASTVTLMEITGVARNLTLNYYIQFEPYVTAGLLYLILTLSLVGLLHWAERRWAGYLVQR
ncbi:ABC transporter permease [Halotalea alkalilenta]|uniref:ABC transporter permease n=1 Tax=Halotalea alkalilenta TaxID=376489 RepID=UPI000482937E|nr:ABC transporter permease subunit [Halotalea alkalilenta]